MQTDGGAPNVVVVATPHDAAELADLLGSVGMEVAWSGDGGDATLARIASERPDVVVLSAFLERGDARALAMAVRGGADGDRIGIVLVGEESGPVRNALDALDFEVDRFIGRPVSSKALRFAVKSAAKGAPLRSVPAPPPEVESMLEPAAEVEAGDNDEEDDGGELEWRLEQATNTAIESFVADAMDALAAPELAESELAEPEAEPEPEPDLHVAAIPERPEVAPPPQREPTLILSDGGVAAAAAAVPVATPVEETRKNPVAPSAGLGLEDLHGDAAGDFDDIEQDLADAVPAGAASDFGRELRAKMSQMAERLFPGRGGEGRRSIDVGVRHDAHTEIDLTAIGVDTMAGYSPEEPAPYADIASGDTFAESHAPSRGTPPPVVKPELRGEIEMDTGAPSTADATREAQTRAKRTPDLGAIRGEISAREEDVASLMARLYRAGFTGRAVLRHAEAEKVVHFVDGQPVFATSNLPHDRMGSLLYREGKITRAQHARSREIVAESGRRMGEILVDMGFLKRRELLPAVRRHIEDVIYSLFAWDSGEYATVPGEAAAGEKIRLSRHPAALLVEGIRRKYGLDILEARLGTADTTVSLRPGDAVAAMLREIELGPSERRVIEVLDGHRSLGEIAEVTGVDLLAVYQVAFGLVVLGMADLERGTDAAGTGVWEGTGRSPSLVGETDIAIDRQRLLAKHAHVAEADYFVLLGVRREASGFEIQRAYEAARRDFAVDTFPTEVREELSGEIEEINSLLEEAFAVLRDDGLRESYRSHLRDWD